MKRIAIIDDEPDIANLVKKGLEQNGFAADAFIDPEDALSSFKPDYYDLVIIDIRMPKMNGFDLYRELRKKDADVRACFLTAFEIYYEEFRKLFPTVEVSAFVKKPVKISSLVNLINAKVNVV